MCSQDEQVAGGDRARPRLLRLQDDVAVPVIQTSSRAMTVSVPYRGATDQPRAAVTMVIPERISFPGDKQKSVGPTSALTLS